MTTRPEMTAQDHARAALEFLEHSDREFAAGDTMQGSEKLWGAASHAVTAIAKQKGWDYGKYSHRVAAVKRLAEEYDDLSLRPAFGLANKFHANFYYDFIEDAMIEEEGPLVHTFVHRILSMMEALPPDAEACLVSRPRLTVWPAALQPLQVPYRLISIPPRTANSVQSLAVATSADTPAPLPLPITGRPWARQMVAIAAGLGMFLSALDISLNVALPYMARDLNATLQTIQWAIVVYVASRAALVLSAGSFADLFGLRRVYIFGAVTYLAAMVCIGLSSNLWSVVAFRALQALGSGCLFAVSPAIAARLFPENRRGLAMGFTTGSQALGSVAGTIGAGMLVQWGGWETIFLGRVPFILLALVLGIWWMSGTARRPAKVAGLPRGSFDVAGAATLGAALLCLVIGLRLGRAVDWTVPHRVDAALALAPVLMAAFWWREGHAPWPVLPRELLTGARLRHSQRIRFHMPVGSLRGLVHLPLLRRRRHRARRRGYGDPVRRDVHPQHGSVQHRRLALRPGRRGLGRRGRVDGGDCRDGSW